MTPPRNFSIATECVAFATVMAMAISISLAVLSYADDQIKTGAPASTDTAGRLGAVAASSVVRVICSAEGTGGSGFLHRSGKVISAAHVVAECDRSKVVLIPSSGGRVAVSEIKLDGNLDLALLTPQQTLSGASLPISSSSALTIGAQVTTWGYPAGYNGPVPLLSVGYLAGEDRVKTSAGVSPPRWVVNAAFNGGNSGGPLLDVEHGTVVGVVSSKLAPIPPDIESALEALKTQKAGFTYTKQHPDGTKETVSEGQVVAEVLRYLRSQTQLVVGHAVKSGDLRNFLQANGLAP
jgi:S1-C subfamily serine protease